ncbi:MAG: TolC family protein [Bryobacteraceae bacterium]
MIFSMRIPVVFPVFLLAVAAFAEEPQTSGISTQVSEVEAPAVQNSLITDTSTPTASAPFFGTPTYFDRVFRPKNPKVELQPPLRLADFVVDGKLELTMRSYLEAVLANNTDIAIQRLTIETPRNAILRSHSIFDPAFTANFNSTRRQTPASDTLAGAAVSNVLTQPLRFGFQQVLPTGTLYSVGMDTMKTSTNSGFALFNPALNANLNMSFSQPLLRGRGSYVTKLPITIARSRLRASEYGVEDQVLRLVAVAENAYWDVIQARENLRVQEQALALYDTSLKRAQRELELGAISSLEIFQPQALYANAEILVSQARFRLAQTEDVLRRHMGADLDPSLRQLPIVLTESIAPPVALALDKEALVQTALRVRPDLKTVRQVLDVDDLTIQSTSNQLRPDLRLTGQYGSAGRGGPFYERAADPLNPGRNIISTTPIPGGWGNAFDQLFGFGYPVYGFGLQLTLPLRDRRAAADYADAVVNRRLDALRVRTAEQSARLEVLTAINQVENSRASVELAEVALDLAQKRADAEQKKFDLGTSTLFFVLEAQTDLAGAQAELVNQSLNYRKNLTNLLRFTGELLSERGISVQ